jgi:hypothetical protein
MLLARTSRLSDTAFRGNREIVNKRPACLSYGAGEPSTSPMAPVISKRGVRHHRSAPAPDAFRPERVKAAMTSQGTTFGEFNGLGPNRAWLIRKALAAYERISAKALVWIPFIKS